MFSKKRKVAIAIGFIIVFLMWAAMPTPQPRYHTAPAYSYVPPAPTYVPSYSYQPTNSYAVCDSLGCVGGATRGNHSSNCILSTVAGIGYSSCSSH